MRHTRLRPPSPATALSLLALFVALGGTAFAAASASDGGDSSPDRHAGAAISRTPPVASGPVADMAKALGSRKLRIVSASVVVKGNPPNGNYNSTLAQVGCPLGKVALSVSTQWSDFRDNVEMNTVFARLTVDRKGRPKGGQARGARDFPGDAVFTISVLCAG